MIRRKLFVFSVSLVAIAFFCSWIFSRSLSAVDSAGEAQKTTLPQKIISKPVLEPEIEHYDVENRAANELSFADEDCLSPEQLESHPLFYAEAQRIDAVAVTGPTIQSYRGISPEVLENLAAQGDSAAMAVLGAVSLLKARNITADKAVPFLLLEDTSVYSYTSTHPLDEQAIEHLHEAYRWFYQAALHGRVLALPYAGHAKGILQEGAVGMGWIEQGEFDSLKGMAKSAYEPMTVYNALAFELAPELRDGPFGIIYDMIPTNDWQKTILPKLAEKFERDRLEAKLPPIEIPESTAPSWEDMRSMVCESYLDRE